MRKLMIICSILAMSVSFSAASFADEQCIEKPTHATVIMSSSCFQPIDRKDKLVLSMRMHPDSPKLCRSYKTKYGMVAREEVSGFIMPTIAMQRAATEMLSRQLGIESATLKRTGEEVALPNENSIVLIMRAEKI